MFVKPTAFYQNHHHEPIFVPTLKQTKPQCQTKFTKEFPFDYFVQKFYYGQIRKIRTLTFQRSEQIERLNRVIHRNETMQIFINQKKQNIQKILNIWRIEVNNLQSQLKQPCSEEEATRIKSKIQIFKKMTLQTHSKIIRDQNNFQQHMQKIESAKQRINDLKKQQSKQREFHSKLNAFYQNFKKKYVEPQDQQNFSKVFWNFRV